MRRQISWLVLATTSTVVVSFVIPLCLLVRMLAEERTMAAAEQEASNVAILVGGLAGEPERLAQVFGSLDRRGIPQTGVMISDGTMLGDAEDMADDPEVQQVTRDRTGLHKMDGTGGRVLIPVVVTTSTPDDLDIAIVRSRVTEDQLHAGVAPAWAGIGGLGIVLLLLALGLASRLGNRVSEPLRHVADVAHQLREGQLHARAEVQGTAETAELARALNGLAERTGELLAAERAAVADLSHRLRTPVTALRLDAEAVRDPPLAARLQKHIASLQVTIDAIVAEARRPVRTDLTARTDATAAVAERMRFWEALAEDQDRSMRVHVQPGPLLVPLVESDLTDVIDVLVDNVFAHTPEGTAFDVMLAETSGRVVLVVADKGPGLDPSGRQDRPGTSGLGLDIARRTARASGGELRVAAADEDTGTGTRVEVWLPLLRQ